MGPRYASVRHPNVVMAPALTETAQSQNFKFSSSPSRSISLSLKNHPRKELLSELLEPKLSNGLKSIAGMNGHSPAKTTYSINGLAKNLKNEFLSINKRGEVVSVTSNSNSDGEKADPAYSGTQIGGYMMNSGYMGEPEMGLQKSNKDLVEGEKITTEVDQLIKNLSVVINSDELSANSELNHNVEEIFKAISSGLETNATEIESGPSGESEPMFSDMGPLSNFERDLFNDVDVMNMCVDESLVAVNKDTLLRDRIEEARKKRFQVNRKYEFLIRRLRKMKAHFLGKHAAAEITGVLEYSSNLTEASSRQRCYVSDTSDSSVKCEVKPVPISTLSLFMRQMDHAVNQQSNMVARNSMRQCKYFGSGSSVNNLVSTSNGLRSSLPGSILPPLPTEVQQDLSSNFGELRSLLSKIQQDIDSDVTESSSGCESCDEFVNYSNPHQQSFSISKRAGWKWAEERASLAAKWTWLQSQIADLEYRIRQNTDLRKHVRASKVPVRLEGDLPSASLPPSPAPPPATSTLSNGWSGGGGVEKCGGEGGCSRTRSWVRSGFSQRRVLQVCGVHRSSKKAARPAGLRCSCASSIPGCGLCTGRAEPGQPSEPISTLSVQQRVALLDPAFHPVLSFPQDVSGSLHYDAVMKCSDWQTRAGRIQGGGLNKSTISPGCPLSDLEKSRSRQPPTTCPDHIVDLQRSKAAVMAVSAKIRRKIARGRRRRTNFTLERCRRRKHSGGGESEGGGGGEDSELSGGFNSPVASPASSTAHQTHHPHQHPSLSKDKDTNKRKRENSYDIDNIVIPYSMASATRLEKLAYKEILTPKWRRLSKKESIDDPDQRNGVVRRSSHELEGEEDISDEAAIARHEKCVLEERKKFLSYLKFPNSGLGRGRGHRRTDSRADSSDPNTPADNSIADPMSPREDRLARSGSTERGGGGEESLASPPPTPAPAAPPSEPDTTRRRTVSSGSYKTDHPEVPPYEPRVFPLSDEVYNKMLAENSESQHFPLSSPSSYQQTGQDVDGDGGGGGPVSPDSVSTDSADSYIGVDEDPNDPEWTTVVDRSTKR